MATPGAELSIESTRKTQKKIITRKCCVDGCHNTSLNAPQLSFHVFPQPNLKYSIVTSNNLETRVDIDIREKWIELLKPTKLLKYSRVCSSHFTSSDFQFPEFSEICGTKRRRLKQHAIPSRNLPTYDDDTPSKAPELYNTSSPRVSTSPLELLTTSEENIDTPPVAEETEYHFPRYPKKIRYTESYRTGFLSIEFSENYR